MTGDIASSATEIQRRFQETWTFDVRDLTRPDADQILRQLIGNAREEHRDRLGEEFFGLGPLAGLVSDVNVTEIVVNGALEIWFEKEGRFHRSSDQFLTPFTFKNAIDRICTEAGICVNLAEPFADGRWQNFRAHLAMAPLAGKDYLLTLRRIVASPWTLERLIDLEWASAEAMQQLRSLIRQRKNMLFIGPTGSGKTSVLGATLKALPDFERAIIVEDSDELPVPNAVSAKLLTRAQCGPALREFTLGDLVRQALRMRPERLVVGEVRGGEAKDLLMALATGHAGSLGTLHAADPRQALYRLEMLVQMGAPQWGVQAIRQLIQLSVDHIVVCENANGHRRLAGLYKVAALESFGFLVEQIA